MGEFESGDEATESFLPEQEPEVDGSGVDKSCSPICSAAGDRSQLVGLRSGGRRKKQLRPTRSLPLHDPDFRGVTIYMKNVKVDDEWTLQITRQYQLSPPKKRIRRRRFTEYISSDSEDDEPILSTPFKEKHCASCSATKTPLWRDAEDGTPLCNACGIRYKKYKIRCARCWHIPKKEEGSPTCKFCGSNFHPKPW